MKSQSEFFESYGEAINALVEKGYEGNEELLEFAGCIISELEDHSVFTEDDINEIVKSALAIMGEADV